MHLSLALFFPSPSLNPPGLLLGGEKENEQKVWEKKTQAEEQTQNLRIDVNVIIRSGAKAKAAAALCSGGGGGVPFL